MLIITLPCLVENGHNEASLFLRERMAFENNIDPIGPDAPCDLSGLNEKSELQVTRC